MAGRAEDPNQDKAGQAGQVGLGRASRLSESLVPSASLIKGPRHLRSVIPGGGPRPLRR